MFRFMSKRCNPFKQLDDFAKSTTGFWISVGLSALFLGCVIQEIRHGATSDAEEDISPTMEERIPGNGEKYNAEKDRHRVTEPFPVLLEQTLD